MRLPDAVLWDMDGTLVASEPYWMAAETELFEAHGLDWSHEDGLSLVGRDLVESAYIMIARGLPLGAEELVDFLVERVAEQIQLEVPWQPGAHELLGELVAAGVPNALVTMSYRVLADAVVVATPRGTFDAVVPGDAVTRGKPDPEPYLLAADLLGVDISRCVAVEDSVPGVASALASGARTIAVQVMVPIPAVAGLSRVASLADISLDLLARVATGETVDLLAGSHA